jgi:hypothetical protein
MKTSTNTLSQVMEITKTYRAGRCWGCCWITRDGSKGSSLIKGLSADATRSEVMKAAWAKAKEVNARRTVDAPTLETRAVRRAMICSFFMESRAGSRADEKAAIVAMIEETGDPSAHSTALLDWASQNYSSPYLDSGVAPARAAQIARSIMTGWIATAAKMAS